MNGPVLLSTFCDADFESEEKKNFVLSNMREERIELNIDVKHPKELNWNSGGVGSVNQKPFCGERMIFSGTTQYCATFSITKNTLISHS